MVQAKGMPAVSTDPQDGTGAVSGAEDGVTFLFDPKTVIDAAELKGAVGFPAIAKLVKSDPGTVRRVLKGLHRPLGETVCQWAFHLGCDVKDFYRQVRL